MIQVDAEFHCHTRFSDGAASPGHCLDQAARRGIRVLAITDHNTAAGALPFWENPLRSGVLLIPGEEISTDRGHVLAYFVRQTILPGRLDDVLAQVHEQNALAFMAHPYHIPLGNRWRKKRTFHLEPSHLQRLTGIEVENGHNRGAANQLAWQLAEREHLRPLAGSDAHWPFEIGNARTRLDLDDLTLPATRRALEQGTMQPLRRRFSAYPFYLLAGLLNRLSGKRYTYREK